MNYRLSPSDLTFLYDGCKHCFVLKVKHGVSQPSIPLPGIFSKMFWGGGVIIGLIIPLLALTSGAAENQALAVLTSISALAGLLLWEHIWVQAGQAVPLS